MKVSPLLQISGVIFDCTNSFLIAFILTWLFIKAFNRKKSIENPENPDSDNFYIKPMVSMMEAMLIISMLAFLSYAAVCIFIVYKNRRASKNAIIKATQVFTLTLITTVFIYYAIWFFEELSYFIVYEFVKRPGLTVDFSINKGLYYGYILPYALFFANLMLVLVKNKKANLIAVILIYIIFILWGWGWHTLSYWPYRAMPMLCVLSVFYLFDVLIVRFIVKKLLQRTAL